MPPSDVTLREDRDVTAERTRLLFKRVSLKCRYNRREDANSTGRVRRKSVYIGQNDFYHCREGQTTTGRVWVKQVNTGCNAVTIAERAKLLLGEFG